LGPVNAASVPRKKFRKLKDGACAPQMQRTSRTPPSSLVSLSDGNYRSVGWREGKSTLEFVSDITIKNYTVRYKRYNIGSVGGENFDIEDARRI
jgi:hypothetical protein